MSYTLKKKKQAANIQSLGILTKIMPFSPIVLVQRSLSIKLSLAQFKQHFKAHINPPLKPFISAF